MRRSSHVVGRFRFRAALKPRPVEQARTRLFRAEHVRISFPAWVLKEKKLSGGFLRNSPPFSRPSESSIHLSKGFASSFHRTPAHLIARLGNPSLAA